MKTQLLTAILVAIPSILSAQGADPLTYELFATNYVVDYSRPEVTGRAPVRQAILAQMWPGKSTKNPKKMKATIGFIVQGFGDTDNLRGGRVRIDTANHQKTGTYRFIVGDWSADIVASDNIRMLNDSVLIATNKRGKERWIRRIELEVPRGVQLVAEDTLPGILVAKPSGFTINTYPKRVVLAPVTFTDSVWMAEDLSILRYKVGSRFTEMIISGGAIERGRTGYELWGETATGYVMQFEYEQDDRGLVLSSRQRNLFRQDTTSIADTVFLTYKQIDRLGIGREVTEPFKCFYVTVDPPLTPEIMPITAARVGYGVGNTKNVEIRIPFASLPHVMQNGTKVEAIMADMDGEIGLPHVLEPDSAQQAYLGVFLATEHFVFDEGRLSHFEPVRTVHSSGTGLVYDMNIERVATHIIVRQSPGTYITKKEGP